MCHFLLSCCSIPKPRPPLSREWTLPSFLFVMLIALSLTVPRLSCQLAFIVFCSPPPPSAPCTAGLLAVRLSLSLHHSRLLEPIILCSRVLFLLLQPAGTDRNLDLVSLLTASHLSPASSDPLSLPDGPLCCLLPSIMKFLLTAGIWILLFTIRQQTAVRHLVRLCSGTLAQTPAVVCVCLHLSVASLKLSLETAGQMNTINLPFVCWEKLSAPPVVRSLPAAAFTFSHLAGGATIAVFFCLFFSSSFKVFNSVFVLRLKFQEDFILLNRTAFSNLLTSFFFGCLSGDVAPFEALLLKNKNLRTAQTSALRTCRSKNM